jgi:hypothetical protein
LRQLKLPLDERGRRRAANRAEWFTCVDSCLKSTYHRRHHQRLSLDQRLGLSRLYHRHF